MAAPTEVGLAGSNAPAMLATSTTPASVTVESTKQYYIQHNGISEAAAAETDYVMLAFNGATAAATEGDGKAILLSGQRMLVGPGLTSITFDASANTPTVSIIPLISHGNCF